MRYNNDVRQRAAELFSLGFGHRAVAARLGISKKLINKWEYTYRALGKEALLVTTHKKYDFELKLAAVKDFLENGLTKPQIMEKYGIASLNPLVQWIRAYREGGEEALHPKPKGRPRKTPPVYATREEELEARIRELELELEIQKRINALIDEIERKRQSR